MAYTTTNNSPGPGYISWAGATIIYDGVVYTITNGSTYLRYIYWVATETVFRTSDSYPVLTISDCIVFINERGICYSILENDTPHGDGFVSKSVSSRVLADKVILPNHIGDKVVKENHLDDEMLKSRHFQMSSVNKDALDIDSIKEVVPVLGKDKKILSTFIPELNTLYSKAIRANSSLNNRVWLKIGTLDGTGATVGANVELIVSGTGDYGSVHRGIHIIQAGQRDTNNSVRVYSFNRENTTDPLQVYILQISTYKYELWMYLSDYNNPVNYTIISSYGFTFDNNVEKTTMPTGAIETSTTYINLTAPDLAANIASLRTIGTGALQACAGNDSRLADNRTPVAHTHVKGDVQLLATDKLLGRVTTGAGGAEEIACTAAGRALLDDADAAAQRTTLGLGGAAILNVGTAASTVAAGDDSRMTNNRAPTDHTHVGAGTGGQIAHTALSSIGTNTHAAIDTFIGTKAAASGLASLNASSLVVQEPASKATANGIASLNASSLVVQNPASATATKTNNAIPIASATGLLDTWISTASETVKGIVELATSAETTAGLVVQASDTRLVSATRQREVLVAALASGVNKTLPGSMTYTVASNRLLVFVNRLLQSLGATADYQEVSTTQIKFNYNLPIGAILEFIRI